MNIQNERLVKLLGFLESNPQDEFVKYALAMEYNKMNDFENAVLFFDDLLKNHAQYLPTYYQAAKFYELHDEEKAIELYKKGIELAKAQNNKHTQGELETALMILE